MTDTPIYSTMAGDPEFRDLLCAFVADLPNRANRIHDFLIGGQLAEACDVLHQLKGAAGIYGFKSIYQDAQQLEALVKNQGDHAVETAEQLISACKRATADQKPE